MRAQVKELRHATDRTLDPELRQRLQDKAHRLQQQCEQAPGIDSARPTPA
ncbi:DUF6381 family protein [Streptomyces violascens]|uniref:Small hydrophilic protein n=1 Tax=Streptomyces violascens TaxID=67381 RepID=A0ABQ3QRU4_9ACTN|nr:DUF6381 family protein [Streptomyces violascens]GGT84821.1 hypothetical protein GCM10010289_00440 [Streptomyces violascens]GHI39998.1 hypothetical protein Sviol_44060 [Streptomyces violascens]